MTLQIGNKAFTLVEIMVTTAVLSLGAVLIYEAFFILADSFNYYADYLHLASWMDEKIWDAQDSLFRFGSLADIQTEGNLVSRNKEFVWYLSYGLIDRSEDFYLYSIDLILSGQERRKKSEFSRSAYATYHKEEE